MQSHQRGAGVGDFLSRFQDCRGRELVLCDGGELGWLPDEVKHRVGEVASIHDHTSGVLWRFRLAVSSVPGVQFDVPRSRIRPSKPDNAPVTHRCI